MSKHTPGPWQWYWRTRNPEEASDIADCGVFHVKHPGHAYAIARCPQYEKQEQWEANARLIAAAPDLLEALKAFADHFGPSHSGDCPGDDTCDCDGRQLNDMVNAAIAKAEGGK